MTSSRPRGRYCSECILPWVRQHGTCPQCQEAVAGEGIRNVMADNMVRQFIKRRLVRPDEVESYHARTTALKKARAMAAAADGKTVGGAGPTAAGGGGSGRGSRGGGGDGGGSGVDVGGGGRSGRRGRKGGARIEYLVDDHGQNGGDAEVTGKSHAHARCCLRPIIPLLPIGLQVPVASAVQVIDLR